MSKMDNWFRKHDPRTKKARDSADTTNNLFLFKNGKVMAILRPADVALKMAHTKRLENGTMSPAEFDAMLSKQDHQFVGYAAKGSPKILDGYGRPIDELKVGDSFVGCGHGTPFAPPMFMQTGKYHAEVWDGETVVVLPTPDLKGDSNTGIVVKSEKPENRGAIALRGGITEPDCHLPSLNRIITGDPERHYTRPVERNQANAKPEAG